MKLNVWSFLSIMSLFVLSTSALATEPTRGKDKKKSDEPVKTVELFQAIDEGTIEVQFVPKDASQATVIIRNKTDAMLDVQMPKAFGAVHILGQMGMGGMGGMGGGMGGMGGGMGGMGGGMGGMGGGQGMGGGMGGMGGGMGGMGGMGGGMGGMGGGMGGMGGGMFRVSPDRAGKLKVTCVCLEHGKQDPNPRMKYKIVPIEQINDDPRVAKLCELLGEGRLAQNTAQAAAWHMANGLSWNELSAKNRIESQFTGNVRWFNPVELQSAFQMSTLIQREYENYQNSLESSSTSTSTSTSTTSSDTDAALSNGG